MADILVCSHRYSIEYGVVRASIDILYLLASCLYDVALRNAHCNHATGYSIGDEDPNDL